jgi:hypothetical protein
MNANLRELLRYIRVMRGPFFLLVEPRYLIGGQYNGAADCAINGDADYADYGGAYFVRCAGLRGIGVELDIMPSILYAIQQFSVYPLSSKPPAVPIGGGKSPPRSGLRPPLPPLRGLRPPMASKMPRPRLISATWSCTFGKTPWTIMAFPSKREVLRMQNFRSKSAKRICFYAEGSPRSETMRFRAIH